MILPSASTLYHHPMAKMTHAITSKIKTGLEADPTTEHGDDTICVTICQ